MTAFIEYDMAAYDSKFGASANHPPPFSEKSGTPFSISCDGSIYTGSKDYLFFAAIAGVRNETGIPPLLPPRGLPRNLSREAEARVQSMGMIGDFCDGWLTLTEID